MGSHDGEGWAIPRAEGADPLGLLTPREREVLALIARGLTNEEIARELVISEHTVKNHVSSIYRKIRTADRTRAALLAIRAGLASVE